MMQYYQHIRDGRSLRRFKYECVESCHRGTDNPREFEAHLAVCEHILPGVRALVKDKLARGVSVVVEPAPPGEAPGQIDAFPDMPSRRKR